MRLAILADIHGNIHALEAVLDHVGRQGIDRIITIGDIVNCGPDSALCWQRIRALDCPVLHGNHERYVAHYGTPDAPALWESPRFAPLRWTVSQFTVQQRREIGRLPRHVRLPEAPDILFVHASQRSDHDSIAPSTPEQDLQAMFPALASRWVVRGHNHLSQIRFWGERRIVTAGSVGFPLDGNPRAQYLILEKRRQDWYPMHHALPYDLDAALARFHSTGYLQQSGIMAQLYRRDLATASFHTFSFLRLYKQWSQAKELTLEEAFMRFSQL